MHVVVGPASSESATAFVDYASSVLDRDVAELPADVVHPFRRYLAEWRNLASVGTAFEWDTEVPAETAEYLVLAFYRMAKRLAEAAATAGPAAPPAADEFYRLLVTALLDGLVAEGHASAEFAEHLRSFWPGGA